jgi:amino acid adenylation domain-containing protein
LKLNNQIESENKFLIQELAGSMVEQLLEDLRKKNIELWVENGNIRFRAPESAVTPSIKELIKTNKAEIISRLSTSSNTPLSYNQKALFSLYQLYPESIAYNISYAARLNPQADLKKLQRCYQQLLDKHQILRTVYLIENEEIVPKVIDDVFPLKVKVVEHWKEGEIHHWFQEEASNPFDLAQGPVIRAYVLQNTHDHGLENYFFFVIHHIAGDFWSLKLILQEIEAFYEDRPLKIEKNTSYQDFARAEAIKIAGKNGEQQWAYWNEVLKGELPLLSLPLKHARPPVQTFNAQLYKKEFSHELFQKIKQVSKEEKVTPFVFSMAIFQLLLNIYTTQDDILIGTSSILRKDPGLEHLIGNFINPVVVRADLSKDLYLRDFLMQVQKNVINVLDHSEFPFSLLVSRLPVNRDLSRPPLIQVMFNWHKEPKKHQGSLFLGDYQPVRHQGAAYELTLTVTEHQHSLQCEWNYNSDLFDASEIETLAAHYENLMQDAFRKTSCKISELSCLSPQEHQRILFDWNKTEAPYPKNLCVHQLFEAQVKKTPQAIAAVCKNESITYEELNRKANLIANQLTELNPDSLVGIFTNRHIHMLAAMIGIHKSGAAYLPMDHKYPAKRLEYMLNDSKAKIVITEKSLDHLIPESQCKKVFLEDLLSAPDISRETSFSRVQPSNLAYVFYTSGSTGNPKGVMIEHRNSVAFISWAKEFFSKEELSHTLASTSICFDLSVFELFAPLSCGCTVVIVDTPLEIIEHPPKSLSLINTVPSAIKILTKTAGIPPSVQTVSLCGEALSKDVVDKIYELETIKSVVNLYGPSEDTTYSTYCRLPKDHPSTPPIGKPISNSQAYVLDKFLRPAPIGVVGELYLGGDGLARGYLNRPDLTTEKFINNPYQTESRLYRTGDFVRYLSDGNLDFVGRIDHQIKINGYRVELGEIESVILNHPAVEQCLINLNPRSEVKQNERMFAYVKLKIGSETQADQVSLEIEKHLQRNLPMHMQPHSVICIDHFPLTPNGKIDRSRLPEPKESPDKKVIEPKTDEERQILEIWQTILNRKNIGMQDNFFKIGGHSLVATQIISRIRKTFSIQLPLSSIFENPTIEKLAQIVKKREKENLAPTITKQERSSAIPLSFAQQRLWFLDQLISKKGVYNIPSVFEISGDLDKKALLNAFRELHERHESLRTRIANEENGAVQIIDDFSTPIPFQEIICDQPSIDKISNEEAAYPFDLEQGPLYRIRLVQVNNHKFILFWTLHHIISDGWSMGVLFDELNQLYKGYKAGKAHPILPPLQLQYVDFALWQKSYLQNNTLEKQLNYWRTALEGAPKSLDLPTDYPRPMIPSYQGQIYRKKIDEQLSTSLKKIAQQEQASLFMTALASFYTFIHRYTGQNDIVIGSPIANRHHKEIEGIIGLFVNTLALRIQFSEEETFLSILNQTKMIFASAHEHQDIPFEQLVDSIKVERDLSKNPLFQVMFNFVDNRWGLRLEGLGIKEMPPARLSSKFDLTLSFIEEEEGLSIEWEYSVDLFASKTIENLTKYYFNLITQLTTQPEQQIRNFSLNPAPELVIPSKMSEELSTSSFQSVSNLIEAVSLRSGSTPALKDSYKTLSYDEMNKRANQLAHYLLKSGLKKGSLVAISLPRSNDFMIAIIAVLKTGSAYLPLDTEQPLDRLRGIIEDAKAPICITNAASGLLKCPSLKDTCQVIDLDQEASTISKENQHNLNLEIGPSDLAYVIYTSGSTGTPKGVMVTHGNLYHYIHYATETYLPAKGSLLHSSVAFDMMVTVFFSPLISGGLLSILPEGDLDVFLNHLKRDVHYGFIKLTPSKLRLLLAEIGEQELAKKCDVIVLGGEDLLEQDIKGLMEFNLGIYNEYGPTETTVGCVVYKLNKEDKFPSGRIPIGSPLNYVQTYILDQYLQPVPEGVIGELYIGGKGVSLGYLGRPELTERQFVTYPHLSQTVLYKSGDLVKRLSNHRLEYLGRKDDQVKIQGYRVELAEIQQTLLKMPEIKECAVLLNTQKKVVAYVVLKENHDKDTSREEIEEDLAKKLPKFMLPEQLVIVSHIPLTSNGKLDSKKLLEFPIDSASTKKEQLEIKNSFDQQLKEIWSRILKQTNIHLNDDFFALGGSSLLVLELIKQIKKSFFKELRPSDVFAHRSLAQLSALIKSKNVVKESNPVVAVQPTGKSPSLFLIHPGGGLVYRYMALKNYISDQMIYAINNPRLFQPAEYYSSIQEMAAHYIELIKQIQPSGPYLIGGWSLGGVVAYEMAFQLDKQGSTVKQTILIDAYNLSIFDVPESSKDQLSKILENEGIDIQSKEAELYSQVLIKNEKICKQYLPPLYQGNVVLLKASECVKEHIPIWQDPSNGWKGLAQSMTILQVKGAHDQLFDPANIESVADNLACALSLV